MIFGTNVFIIVDIVTLTCEDDDLGTLFVLTAGTNVFIIETKIIIKYKMQAGNKFV
jgi:hypothetical protein